jgi:DMSO/TMAO reductase YedYZ molybdopterin-dependent catalytic subunit
MRSRGWAALSGVVAGAAVLGVSDLVALATAPESAPITAVGAWLIDIAPPAVKDAMIAAFGTGDKPVLIGILLVLLAVGSAGAGLLELRRRWAGVILMVVVALGVAVAVISRAGADVGWFGPVAIGTAAGALLLRLLIGRLETARDAGTGPTRRSFLLTATIAGVAAGFTVVAGRAQAGAAQAADRARTLLRLPAAAEPAAAVPASADLQLQGLAPYVTPNADFYRIDTALVVPNLDAADWTLRIHGLVEREVEITFEQLLAMPLIERHVTLACVSNEVGGSLIGNALWLGYPIHSLLEQAGVRPEADMVLSRSSDGFTASTPLEVLQDPQRDSLLAVGMNGDPLPLEHGFPVRMVVPGLYGYVSATKWVVELEVTRFDAVTAYWTDRGWSAEGPIKTQSRIDVPSRTGALAAGERMIAGVAWAQHTGVERVEVRVDGGAWQEAALAGSVGDDTWVQWSLPWTADAGDHELQVRATDRTGATQTSSEQGVVPDGATGWHTVRVSVV